MRVFNEWQPLVEEASYPFGVARINLDRDRFFPSLLLSLFRLIESRPINAIDYIGFFIFILNCNSFVRC